MTPTTFKEASLERTTGDRQSPETVTERWAHWVAHSPHTPAGRQITEGKCKVPANFSPWVLTVISQWDMCSLMDPFPPQHPVSAWYSGRPVGGPSSLMEVACRWIPSPIHPCRAARSPVEPRVCWRKLFIHVKSFKELLERLT